jgi:large repetitive protein
MTRAMIQLYCVLLALMTFALGGCTSLLGDFSYDENAGRRGIESVPAQGDIVVDPIKGLVTTEAGGKATFTIVLGKEPTSPVIIGLESSNPLEGTVNPSALTFTPDNWAAPQMVQVTGVDDALEDGAQVYKINTTFATSTDAYFAGLDPLDPEVTNTDNDTAGVTVTPPGGLVTSESGAEATFTLQLNKAPTSEVTIPLSSDTPSEGTVAPAAVTFTPENWMAPQTVTVVGVDDPVKDGERPYLVATGPATSEDPKYNGLDAADVSVKNLDNETAGILLSPSSGLVTYENKQMTSLTVALASPPLGPVVVGLSSSDVSEGTVSPSSVTFTTDNWMAPQVVSVMGEDDPRVDGDQPYQVLTSIISAEDNEYLTLTTLPKADVINIDDDFPRIVVDAAPMLSTSEDLEAAIFTVSLLTKPTGLVKVDVASLRPEEGVASPTLLTFDEENWKATQTVTVMGVNDDVADGPQSYLVRVKPNAETLDEGYRALLEQDVTLTNIDNDSAGFRVTPLGELRTTERGGTATFSIELTSKPKADVTIPLRTSDDSEGTVTPNQLFFTTDNYKSAQVVTVRGVDDPRADGDQPFRIITDAPVTTDADYAKLDVPNVDLSNQDDDTAGITVEPRGVTLYTGENGQTATCTVRLNSEPKMMADVVLPIESMNVMEGTVSPSQLRFTTANWRAPQTVTIKGVQDSLNDGDIAYKVRFGTVQSADTDYAGDRLRPLDVQAVNVDDDSPFIRVANYTGLTTSEKSGSAPATFQVSLGSQPRAPVTIGLSSSRTGEGTVSPTTLTFNANNWSSPQTVTVFGVDEKIQDGPQTFLVVFARSSSNDTDYQGLLPNPSTISVTNQDDDSAGILVKAAANIATGEPNVTATFTVELTSQPLNDVTIPLASSNTKEGTVSPASLTFTGANWSAPRTVTLTGVDDSSQDGNQQYNVSVGPASSADSKYNGKTAPDVKVVNKDNDTAGIVVGPVVGTASEDGGTASFTLKLQTLPSANVQIAISSGRTKEVTVNPAMVTFTPANWASEQKITLLGINDDVQDGDQQVLIDIDAASSSDPLYKGMDAPDVTVTNRDNDTAEILVEQLSNRTNENGGTATFSVALRTQPAGGATVTLPLTSSDTGEGTLSASSLTFNDVNWKSPQLVTVTGVDDDGTADNDQPYQVTLGPSKSADPNYDKKSPLPLSFTNQDNDSAGIVVSPLTGETSEDSEPMSFTVVLLSRPKATVRIPITSTDMTEGTVSASELVFTNMNWAAKQTVTVTGEDDDEYDGSPSYKVTVGKPTTTDSDYAELDPDDVSLVNIDNDVPGIVVTPAEGNTTEAGGKTRFSVRLRSKPKGAVSISLKTSDDTEGSLNVTQVAFTAGNWDMPQGVDVYGEDDDEQDGDQPYTIITGLSVSMADPDYDGIVVPDVNVINLDNDTAGFVIGAVSGHTSEAGGKATFTVALRSKPTASVTIPISSNTPSEGTLALEQLVFTTTSWNMAQTVTVTGENDDVADGNVEYKIVLGKAVSTDANYSMKDPSDVIVVNDDDDSAALLLNMPASAKTGEAMSSEPVSFTVVLSSKPTGNVTIPITSSNTAEGVVTSPMMSLVFTPNDWSTEQEVVVQGVDDEEADGDVPYFITVGPPQSSDSDYNTLMAQKVALTNLDDEPAPTLP